MSYPKIAQVINYISAANGGCTADEIEQMLEYATDADLWIIADGEEREQQATIARLLEESGAGITIESVNDFFNAAFDAP